jgi:MATE family multidrug resistance protein
MSQALVNPLTSRASPTRELFTLALPIIGLTVTRMLMSFIDFAMVSPLGTQAQAAISPASILVFTIACIGMGVAQAVQTFVAQADGRGQPEQAGAYAWQSFYVAAVCGLLTYPLAATTPVWFGWLAALGQHGAAVRDMEIQYVEVALWFVAPSIVCAGLDAFFSGVQKPRISLIAALVSLGVNGCGNWLLIYGKLGFPRLGIRGAAIATVIGWCCRAAVLFAALLLPDYDARYKTRRSFAFCWEKMRDLLRIGGPTSVQWLVDIGSWVVFMVLMMPPFGVAAMAATNVGLQYMHLSFMPAVGVGIALCSQVGFAIGAGRPDQAVQRTRIALRVTVGYMGAVGLLFLLARRPLTWLFNADPAVMDAGGWVLMWAAIFQVFDAMGITFMNALRGAGDTRWPAVATFIMCWGVFVGGGYAVSRCLPQYGLNGPWFTCTSYIVLLGVLLWWRWNAGAWRKLRLFGEQARRDLPLAPVAPAAP